MYTIKVPFKGYDGRKHNMSASFNLDAREVFRMLPELKSVFDWLESNKNSDPRELSTEEVRNFYTDFEDILLLAWGEMDEDGLYFRKGGKYDFEESALFNACMVQFVTQPEETTKLLEGILPEELFEMVKNLSPEALAAAAEGRATEQQDEIARLRAQLAAAENGSTTAQ